VIRHRSVNRGRPTDERPISLGVTPVLIPGNKGLPQNFNTFCANLEYLIKSTTLVLLILAAVFVLSIGLSIPIGFARIGRSDKEVPDHVSVELEPCKNGDFGYVELRLCQEIRRKR